MDEVFSGDNFCSLLYISKKDNCHWGLEFFEGVSDYILWYAKNKASVKTRPLMRGKSVEGDNLWTWAQALDGSHRKISATERDNHKSLPKDDRCIIGSYHCFQPNIDQIKTLYSILTARNSIPPKSHAGKQLSRGWRECRSTTYSADRSFNPTSSYS